MTASLTPIDYDVIVVGARVAGAPTAMLLARMGHHVLLVDRAQMPSDTLSTHAVTRTGALQLHRWGLLERLVSLGTPPVRHVTLGFGDERVLFPVREEHGVGHFVAPRRYILDSMLVQAAVEAGVEFLGKTRLTDLVWVPEDQVAGVVIGGAVVTARMVVGADGVNSRVARLVGAQAYRSHRPLNAVNYAYFKDVDFDGYWFQFTPKVNAGFISTNDKHCLVFVGRPTGQLGQFRDDPDSEFMRLLELGGGDLVERMADASRVSPYRGTPGLPGFVRQSWGNGWALVGDAGYTKDPISAHGISDSFRDAELCALAVDATLRSRSSKWLRAYQRVRDRISLGLFEESRRLAEYRWDPAEASQRVRRISKAVESECEMLLDSAGAIGVSHALKS